MRSARLRSGARLVQWAGWAALAGGAVLCAIGWYGVSGERFAERQIPFLASCTIPGAALIVAGAVLVARGGQGLAAARVAELYGLLVTHDGEEPAGGAAPRRGGEEAAAGPPGALLAVPGGSLLHRPDCPLVAGKPAAAPATSGQLSDSGAPLTPCPVCEPSAGS